MTGTSSDPPPESAKQIVRAGWDRASTIYRPPAGTLDAFGHTSGDYEEWLRPLFASLSRGSEVLDLGCGCGVPVAASLASRFQVTGVDISDVQIDRARRLVPRARFVPGDMALIHFPARSFAAITCLYALIHVPLAEQRPLLERLFDWLAPGGLLLLTTGETAWTGIEEDWLGSGAPTYWSHADGDAYEEWLGEAGFTILERRRVPEGDAAHALFLGRRPPLLDR